MDEILYLATLVDSNAEKAQIYSTAAELYLGSTFSHLAVEFDGLTQVADDHVLVVCTCAEHSCEIHYSKWRAIDAMKAGKVAILSGGTGNPFFTTDTGASLRGVEVEADVMLKGTRVKFIFNYLFSRTNFIQSQVCLSTLRQVPGPDCRVCPCQTQ